MAHSEPGSGQRTEVVRSTEPTPRGPRNGYLLLAISGVVLATAFGGIAQLAAPSKTAPSIDGGNDSPGSQQVAPYSTGPDTDSTTEDSSSTTADSSSSPTMSVGPDGRETATSTPSSRTSKSRVTPPSGGAPPSGTTTGGPGTGPTTQTPPPNSSTPPETTTPPTTTTTSITPTPSSRLGQR